jgi:hypothetical protein
MTTRFIHSRLNETAASWLLWLTDPDPRRAAPTRSLDARELPNLLDAAELHGVLALCLSGLKRPDAVACGASKAGLREEILAQRTARNVELLGVQMLLAHHGDAICAQLSALNLPFTVVKGRTFARMLYANPVLRRYTDIDLLIAPSSRPEVSAVLANKGFELHEMDYRNGNDYFEDKWTFAAPQEILVEVHRDLVHNPRLRRVLSLTYADVLEAGDGASSDPTALFLIASAHGAIGHQFDRLQQLIDVLQCARGVAGPINVPRLRKVTDRCGLTLSVAAALALAERTFKDERCRSLLRQFAPRNLRFWAVRLLSPHVLLAAQSDRRALSSFRRKAFRQALRLGRTRDPIRPPPVI